MIEIALSTATQRRLFLPFLPLTVSQLRRRALDNATPMSCEILVVRVLKRTSLPSSQDLIAKASIYLLRWH
jgi:hypothetical protein